MGEACSEALPSSLGPLLRGVVEAIAKPELLQQGAAELHVFAVRADGNMETGTRNLAGLGDAMETDADTAMNGMESHKAFRYTSSSCPF